VVKSAFDCLPINAPELPGHCARNRNSVEGDPFASASSLQEAVTGKSLTIERAGVDRYGRTLAVVYASGANLSCVQLAAGQAAYIRRYDNGGLVARDCPELTSR
jgi:endonuclease YncB( thermonuclease family)